jgi:leucyl-tRNA synthetase
VLISYGTGAIMAVPAHDTRDFEFAKQFNLPIITVVDPGETKASSRPLGEGPQARAFAASNNPLPKSEETDFVAFIADGIAINSGPYDGLTTPEFKKQIAKDLSQQGIGRTAVNYRLRDWLFSRQHFWGEPFPILHELDAEGNMTGRIRALEPSDLPIDLPAKMTFDAKHDEPTPPLDKAPADWLYVTLDGRRYKRETNTMPQWAGSCWYYLRFLDPKNPNALIDPAVEKAWMPVDLYVGGAEHAVLHLLYARFWHKVLFDRGYVSQPEPFQKLVNQGMILGENNEKMSKSRGNVVNPDEVVREYGADALRLYEMFMGPLEAVKPWSMDGVSGVRGFLDRAWRMILDDRAEAVQLNAAIQDIEPTPEQNRMLHKTIKAVTNDLDAMSFNTAIARMMEFTNFFTKSDARPRVAMEKLVLLLAPFAPHMAEELWQALGHQKTLAYEPWPTFDESAIKEDTIEIPIQVNGKLRGKILVAAGVDKAALESAALADAKVQELLSGKTIVKTVVVPGRMVNFVIP